MRQRVALQPMNLAGLLPDEDFRFHVTLRRGDARDFFAVQDPTGAVQAERARWLAQSPARYAALTPEGEPLLDEFVTIARSWSAADPLGKSPGGPMAAGAARILALGAAFEPDILLLSRGAPAEGGFILRGGVLCFPTGWALEEKIGQPMNAIHRVVPGLNAAIGAPIDQVLASLRTGGVLLRDNWGIAATEELNLHPVRGIAAPAPPVALDRLWLRVEHQALLALPRTGGVVFAIRIALHRLDSVASDPAAAQGLRRALATMPAAMSEYKRIDTIRTEVIRLL